MASEHFAVRPGWKFPAKHRLVIIICIIIIYIADNQTN